jgi:hypothetical protein
MRINEIITEATNPDIHHSEFKHEQEIGGLLYKAEADNNSGYGTTLVITVYNGRKQIASTEFIIDEDHNSLVSANTWVLPKYQDRGVATTMYAYAKMLGNDIVPSRIQTDQGNSMWRSWNQSKQSKHILPRGHKGYNEDTVGQSLAELFEPGKDYKWSFTGSEEAVAVFHIGEVPYQFHAYTYPGENGTWEVEFKNAERGRGRTTKFGLTGTGNSAEVMSTITDIMREFLQRYQGKVTALTFTADEQSRQSLYARMAKRLLPTWQLTQTDKQFILTAPAN